MKKFVRSTYNLIFYMVFSRFSSFALMKSRAWVEQRGLQDAVVLREGNSGDSKNNEWD